MQIPRPGKEKPLVIDSPLPDDPTTFHDNLPKLLDYTTTSPGAVIRGRVNIDRAPEVVLKAIPGIDETLASRILTSRQPAGGASGPGSTDSPTRAASATSGDDPLRRHALWLLSDGLVSLEQMKALLPYVTGGG